MATAFAGLPTAKRRWSRELRRPDLVLLDFGCPVSTDSACCDASDERHDAVIVLSARGEERHKVEALDAGADDYLAKPFGMAGPPRVRAALSAPWRERSTEQSRLIGRMRLDPAADRDDSDGGTASRPPRIQLLSARRSCRPGGGARPLPAPIGTTTLRGHYVHVYVGQIRRKIAALDPDGASPTCSWPTRSDTRASAE